MADWLLSPGDQTPAFALEDQNGNQVSLGDFAGRKLAIFFFPKALTPG
jgi:peroxiredoxin Q/BCP